MNPKAELISQCIGRSLPIVSALGAASRTDPMKVRLGLLTRNRGVPRPRGHPGRYLELNIRDYPMSLFDGKIALTITMIARIRRTRLPQQKGARITASRHLGHLPADRGDHIIMNWQEKLKTKS